MEERAKKSVAFSSIGFFASLSVLVLLGIGITSVWRTVTGGNDVSAINTAAVVAAERPSSPWSGVNWQAPASDTATDGANEADRDGLSNIEGNVTSALLGSYVALNESGFYTPEDGEKIAADIAETLRAHVSFATFAVADVKTDPDTSYQGMLTYRDRMRVALEPLLSNPGYELSLFANYIDSKDRKYADLLATAAKNYSVAVEKAAEVTVPADAREIHVRVLNALSEFGATVEAMSRYGDDAFASAALLQSYSISEQTLIASFDALAQYQKRKTI